MQLTEQQKNESIAKMQSLVDDLRKTPQFRKYVEQRKLELIDSRLRVVDDLLRAGKLH